VVQVIWPAYVTQEHLDRVGRYPAETAGDNSYDKAVALLRRLRDLAEYQGRMADFQARVADLHVRYANRPALRQRLQRARLL